VHRGDQGGHRARKLPDHPLGHVRDGNFHLGLLIDPDDPRELEEARELSNRLVMRALAMNGTCTGEHGVGLGKRRYLQAEHGEAIALMASIKQLLDPKSIMNPGKVLP
jgi:D-lactate dehydrogenase (cytochrome)